eukprot:2638848-Rhodomonas_salina.1
MLLPGAPGRAQEQREEDHVGSALPDSAVRTPRFCGTDEGYAPTSFIEHVLQQYYIDRFKFRGINVKSVSVLLSPFSLSLHFPPVSASGSFLFLPFLFSAAVSSRFRHLNRPPPAPSPSLSPCDLVPLPRTGEHVTRANQWQAPARRGQRTHRKVLLGEPRPGICLRRSCAIAGTTWRVGPTSCMVLAGCRR